MCVRIFQLFQFQVAYRIKKMACVYMIVCVHVYVCVCAWQMVAHICFIVLAAKGLINHPLGFGEYSTLFFLDFGVS